MFQQPQRGSFSGFCFFLSLNSLIQTHVSAGTYLWFESRFASARIHTGDSVITTLARCWLGSYASRETEYGFCGNQEIWSNFCRISAFHLFGCQNYVIFNRYGAGMRDLVVLHSLFARRSFELLCQLQILVLVWAWWAGPPSKATSAPDRLHRSNRFKSLTMVTNFSSHAKYDSF
jgi:hypothetical protein